MGRHSKGAPRDGEAKYDAIESVQKASEALEAARHRTQEVRSIAETLRMIRERNHLGEAIRDALKGI